MILSHVRDLLAARLPRLHPPAHLQFIDGF
jgi:hypothetical protein